MYNCNRFLLFSLSALLVAQLVAETVVIAPIVVKMKGSACCGYFRYYLTRSGTAMSLPSSFTGCVPNPPSDHMWAYWIPMIVFEATLCTLAIIKAIHIAHTGTHRSRLLITMLRDTVIYFGGILVIIVINFGIWVAARVSIAIFKPATHTLTPLCGLQPSLFGVAIG